MALWGPLTATSVVPTARIPACTPFELPSGGAIVFNRSYTSTLTTRLTFQQPCDDPNPTSYTTADASGNSTVIAPREPFYASTSPQIFAIATATVISYLLVIIIFITPRTLHAVGGGRGAGASGAGLRGRGANSASVVSSVGRRPWLQKIATITVAISLTIATADTFRVAKEQYDMGYTYAALLVDDVVGSLEIRIVRVISDTILWLAQVQTLIRLFPRHKEKVTIKWLGFALVSLDTIFSILDDFVNQSVRTRPRSFQDAIPALAYLFELAISLIYASCVIYYSLSKRRFAFWHNRMRNICLLALLSLVAVLIPVVFFVLDVSKPDVAGWGDYIRWVGAAAASVVVWEWVERIETLERDERKDGILGREIFDGDEMLDDPTGVEDDFHGRRQYWNRHDFPSDDARGPGGGGMRLRNLRSHVPFVSRLRNTNAKEPEARNVQDPTAAAAVDSAGQITVPAQVMSPVSRTENTSAGSTIYAIRYHTVNTPAGQEGDEAAGYVLEHQDMNTAEDVSGPSSSATAAENGIVIADKVESPVASKENEVTPRNERNVLPVWRTVPNPFKRRRASPPAEVAAQIAENGAARSPVERGNAFRERFASARRNRSGKKQRGGIEANAMGVTVIPAQPRGNRAWTSDGDGHADAGEEPDEVTDEQEEQLEATEQQRHTPNSPTRRRSTRSPPSPQDLSAYEMPILVIPAPRRGQRTWSPEDAYTGPVMQSPVSSPVPTDHPPPPPDGAATRSPVFSMRGSLIISEDHQTRSPPLRRSTYSRSSPIYVREQGTSSAASSSSKPQPQPVAAASPPRDGGTIVEGNEGTTANPNDQGSHESRHPVDGTEARVRDNDVNGSTASEKQDI